MLASTDRRFVIKLPDNLPNDRLRSKNHGLLADEIRARRTLDQGPGKARQSALGRGSQLSGTQFPAGHGSGDQFFFYHSSCPEPGIAGIGRIIQAAYPDPTALEPESHYVDPKATPEKNAWSAIDVAHVETFSRVLKLDYLKQQTALAEMPLVQKGSRLSVMPVTAEQWAAVIALKP